MGGPPLIVLVFAGLVLMAVALVRVGRVFKDQLDARARGTRQAAAIAEAQQEESDLQMGIARVFDPLGILV